ncbi:MAG: PRC-barrel domain containing protein [Candidatus Magasanikbacteria bacterium]|nr:PRC-barrel domain containing protein [Candidatus Magasanikbacteria bacterium]
MFINLKSLIRLPVHTESGAYLGRVYDAELEVESHYIRHYLVAAGLIKKADYRITPAQVKAITAEKMIVEDSVSKISTVATSPVRSSAPLLGSVSASNRE